MIHSSSAQTPPSLSHGNGIYTAIPGRARTEDALAALPPSRCVGSARRIFPILCLALRPAEVPRGAVMPDNLTEAPSHLPAKPFARMARCIAVHGHPNGVKRWLFDVKTCR